VEAGSGAPDGGVTRCDCRLRERGSALIAAARIPKRYEHCELSDFNFEDRSCLLRLRAWRRAGSWKNTR